MKSLGILRPINDNEIETIRTWRNSSGVRMNMYSQHEITLAEHEKWWARIKDSTTHKYFMYEANGAAMGVVGFNEVDQHNQHSFWAFYSSPDAVRGTGVNMEFLAIEYAFNTLSLHKLSCEVLSYNTAVIKLHRKFGFEVEGVFRQHRKIDLQFVDVYRLGLLSYEWSNMREKMLTKIERAKRL